MYRLPLHVPQLRHPLSYKLAFLIKLLRLQPRIEDAKVRLRVDASGRRESPATVIGREVPVNEVRYKVLFAEAPVEEEVFCEEGGGDHAVAIVHIAGVVE